MGGIINCCTTAFFFCRRAAVFQILAIWQFPNMVLLQEVKNQSKGDNPQHHQHQRKDDVADRPDYAYTILQGDFQKYRDKGCQQQQADNQRRQTELLKF